MVLSVLWFICSSLGVVLGNLLWGWCCLEELVEEHHEEKIEDQDSETQSLDYSLSVRFEILKFEGSSWYFPEEGTMNDFHSFFSPLS